MRATKKRRTNSSPRARRSVRPLMLERLEERCLLTTVTNLHDSGAARCGRPSSIQQQRARWISRMD